MCTLPASSAEKGTAHGVGIPRRLRNKATLALHRTWEVRQLKLETCLLCEHPIPLFRLSTQTFALYLHTKNPLAIYNKIPGQKEEVATEIHNSGTYL